VGCPLPVSHKEFGAAKEAGSQSVRKLGKHPFKGGHGRWEIKKRTEGIVSGAVSLKKRGSVGGENEIP